MAEPRPTVGIQSENSNSNSSHSQVDTVLNSLDPASSNWKRVTFRCMIQDILDNEIYKASSSSKYSDRTIFYCITIPGENDWVRNCTSGDENEFMTNFSPQKHHNSSKLCVQSTASNTTSSSSPQATATINSENPASPSSLSDSLRQRNNKISFTLVNYSYPVPSDTKNKSCLIKVYDEKLVAKLRVNDIVLVSGRIEPTDDGSLTTYDQKETNSASALEEKVIDLAVDSFEAAHDLPDFLVPRVHVSSLRKLSHINPLLPETVLLSMIDSSLIKLAHSRLSTILTQLFAGDSFTAEYMILSLISSIHTRRDVTTLGQFTLNITGVKPEMKFLIDKIYEFVTKITTHSHMIDMSIANLNNLKFTPQKDYENGKMMAGTLQMPDGMYIVLNETALGEGQLTSLGTENLSTLNQIIRWQKHSYDFKYPVDIDTDLKFLVLSEGKSILTVPYQIKLKVCSDSTIAAMKEACDSVNTFLNDDLLNLFRKFITLPRFTDYSIPDEVNVEIQNDFLSWRKRDEHDGRTLFSGDDLSSYLTVARYVTLSRGEEALTSELWKEACMFEERRQESLNN